MRVAAVFTAYNRKAFTVACLRSLMAETAAAVDVFMLDDGSTDGTADAVRDEFPGVHLLSGDGTFFWVKGMARALAAARAGDYDFYLWLNDDVVLDRGFLDKLLTAYAQLEPSVGPSIIVGATRGADGRISYGGHVLQRGSRLRLDFERLEASPELQACDSFSGNCVLVPRAVVARIGMIDGHFFHNFADFDYGLRALSAGFRNWQAPGTIGVCEANTKKDRHAQALRYGNLAERWSAFWNRSCHHMPSRIRYFVRHLGLSGLIPALSTIRYLVPFGARRRAS